MIKVNTHIFREYDIRGKVDDDLGLDVTELLGRGFGTFLIRNNAKKIGVSGDVRLSTPSLVNAFKKGLHAAGVDTVDLGILPTPVNYYSMYVVDIDGAVQITGSHNPPEFNGFKLSLRRAAVFGPDIQTIRKYIEENDFTSGAGTDSSLDIRKQYVAMILEKIKLSKKMKIVMDCGNAAGALLAPEIFKKLGVDVKELYCDVDGRFPNHHPDPTVEKNLKDLIAEMKKGSYDAGIAFDGDADRVGVVDDKGRIIWADLLMAILAKEIIGKNDKVVYDVKCSQALEDVLVKLGGIPVMSATGHSILKKKMKEMSCKLGGELSGHIFLADEFFGFDDAIYVAARVLRLLSNSTKKLSDLFDELPSYKSSPELRFECENDEIKFRISKGASEYFKKAYKCIDVDGVRIQFGDGWGLVRASNTQPEIVCRFEASTDARLSEIQELVLGKLREFGLK